MRPRHASGPAGPSVALAILLFISFAQIALALGDGHGAGVVARAHGRSRKWKGRQLFDAVLGKDGVLQSVAPGILNDTLDIFPPESSSIAPSNIEVVVSMVGQPSEAPTEPLVVNAAASAPDTSAASSALSTTSTFSSSTIASQTSSSAEITPDSSSIALPASSTDASTVSSIPSPTFSMPASSDSAVFSSPEVVFSSSTAVIAVESATASVERSTVSPTFSTEPASSSIPAQVPVSASTAAVSSNEPASEAQVESSATPTLSSTDPPVASASATMSSAQALSPEPVSATPASGTTASTAAVFSEASIVIGDASSSLAAVSPTSSEQPSNVMSSSNVAVVSVSDGVLEGPSSSKSFKSFKFSSIFNSSIFVPFSNFFSAPVFGLCDFWGFQCVTTPLTEQRPANFFEYAGLFDKRIDADFPKEGHLGINKRQEGQNTSNADASANVRSESHAGGATSLGTNPSSVAHSSLSLSLSILSLPSEGLGQPGLSSVANSQAQNPSGPAGSPLQPGSLGSTSWSTSTGANGAFSLSSSGVVPGHSLQGPSPTSSGSVPLSSNSTSGIMSLSAAQPTTSSSDSNFRPGGQASLPSGGTLWYDSSTTSPSPREGSIVSVTTSINGASASASSNNTYYPALQTVTFSFGQLSPSDAIPSNSSTQSVSTTTNLDNARSSSVVTSSHNFPANTLAPLVGSSSLSLSISSLTTPLDGSVRSLSTSSPPPTKSSNFSPVTSTSLGSSDLGYPTFSLNATSSGNSVNGTPSSSPSSSAAPGGGAPSSLLPSVQLPNITSSSLYSAPDASVRPTGNVTSTSGSGFSVKWPLASPSESSRIVNVSDPSIQNGTSTSILLLPIRTTSPLAGVESSSRYSSTASSTTSHGALEEHHSANSSNSKAILSSSALPSTSNAVSIPSLSVNVNSLSFVWSQSTVSVNATSSFNSNEAWKSISQPSQIPSAAGHSLSGQVPPNPFSSYTASSLSLQFSALPVSQENAESDIPSSTNFPAPAITSSDAPSSSYPADPNSSAKVPSFAQSSSLPIETAIAIPSQTSSAPPVGSSSVIGSESVSSNPVQSSDVPGQSASDVQSATPVLAPEPSSTNSGNLVQPSASPSDHVPSSVSNAGPTASPWNDQSMVSSSFSNFPAASTASIDWSQSSPASEPSSSFQSESSPSPSHNAVPTSISSESAPQSRPTLSLQHTSAGTEGIATLSAIPSDSASSNSSSVNSENPSPLKSVSAPTRTGSQVVTFTESSSSASESASSDRSSTASWSSSTYSSTLDDAYTPSQTWLIVATSTAVPAAPTSSFTSTPTTSRAQGESVSPSLPATASIPSSVPTLIVPANSVINQANAGSGKDDDPVKDDTLIALLLSQNEYPWLFVVKSSDATSQLFNTFPPLVAGALNMTVADVKTYGLMVYQPAAWDGKEASLLTQWLAYIPVDKFDTLNAYLRTSGSPLFNQPGIQGQLAAQINTAYPLAASAGDTTRTSTKSDGSGSNTKKRDIIIGVCVAIGGLLWIGLVFWIYKRVKRSNEKAVHKRLSEHMSMFDGGNHVTYGGVNDNRLSRAVSIAASDIDDRPSSFYASPVDNDRSMRQYQRDRTSDNIDSIRTGASLGHESPNNYGPSVFGTSWFANPPQQSGPSRQRAQNPFEDMVQQSYLNTSSSNGNIQHHLAAQRRSQAIQKGMISQPTLQAHSLEFKGH